MNQFGRVTYQGQPDYIKSMNFVESFKLIYSINESNHGIIREAVSENLAIGKAALIYARLYFWGFVKITDLIRVLKERLSNNNFNQLGMFERQELELCLGHELLSAFLNETVTSISDILNLTNDSISVKEKEKNRAEEVWCYIPPPTGFFSVIENIIYAKFICKTNNKIFKLDMAHNWWKYPIPFMEFIDSNLATEYNLNVKSDYYLTWDVLRETLAKIPPERYEDLAKFKFSEYKKIKGTLQSFYSSLNRPTLGMQDGCICYIRGGDKILLETITTPKEFLHYDINRLAALDIPIYLLSDDFSLAENIKNEVKVNNIKNITKKIFNGYFLQSNSIDDVHAILENYIILSNTRFNLSCPSSNLVNSANWSNERLSKDFNFRSYPGSKYLFL